MTLLATAGALTEITRLREAPGGYDDTGRWQPGEVTETTLLASVQPLGLIDAETAGGAQSRNRLRVFVPYVQVSTTNPDGIMSGDDVLGWGADVLGWGGTSSLVDLNDAPLVAAFSDREADRVRLAAGVFVVESSEAWPGHVEAVLFREP